MLNRDLVDELRRLFLDGATPSRLMHQITLRHEGDPRLHFIIADYFREAFGIPLLRNVVPDDDYAPAGRHAHYNRDVLPEIIQRIGDWNAASLEGSWLKGVSVHSLADHAERLEHARFEELDRVWDKMSDEEKHFVIRKVALKDCYWDAVKSIAQLAEQLQRKVVELEARLNQRLPEEEFAEEEAAPETAGS